ncbi:MAG: threonine synthase [Planctomycetota bacterium]
MNQVSGLVCKKCKKSFEPGKLVNLCPCGGPIEVQYDLEPLVGWRPREGRGVWRYRPVLPIDDSSEIVSLGEGGTPLEPLPCLGRKLGLEKLWLKEEGGNPTGSFKARGMTLAVTMAKKLGAKKLAVPSAGNAAGAMAAYARRAGMEAYVFMPKDVPEANRLEVIACGAHVTLVDGLINDCGRMVAERKDAEGWFDVSTLKEPYRIEGKKTMGYELFEDLGGRLPDVIFYPTGGGTGLIGMWKAFDEMQRLGWIGSERPRMVTVQAEGCAPIVKALAEGGTEAPMWEGATTCASGLRVPKAVGDFWMLQVLRDSQGTAVAVSDEALLQAVLEVGAEEGFFLSPEGAACIPALRQLIGSGFVRPNDEVVVFNTGSGFKYLDVLKPAIEGVTR